jgi:hypothetical protein
MKGRRGKVRSKEGGGRSEIFWGGYCGGRGHDFDCSFGFGVPVLSGTGPENL